MRLSQRVASRWISARQRQRRQKGEDRRERRQRYRRTKATAKRQSARYRKTHRHQTKRYQKRYRKNPKRFQRRRAGVFAFNNTPFVDLEHGVEGEIQHVDCEGELVQTILNGEPREYGLWDFLDTAVFPTEESEGEFFGQLDQEFDVEDEDDDADDDGLIDEVDEDFDLGPDGV